MASLLADWWRHKPKMKTMTTPASAKTRGSGNQRSLQVAKASPKRAKPLSRATKFLARWDGIDFDGIDPPLLACIRLPWDCGDRVPLPRLSDRKSTRLNSSHANISYAVFCLKKKQ